MRRTYSNEPIERIVYLPLGNGLAEVYLHDNIRESQSSSYCEESCTMAVWSADEVCFQTLLTMEEVSASFDALWVQAETESKSDKERIADLEETVNALVEVVLGV